MASPSETATANRAGPYSLDYRAPFWEVDLSEVLRLIQLYKCQGYHVDAQSEDGYAPNPPAAE